MTKIALSGAAGRIGKTICATLIGRNDFEILFGVDARGGEDFPFLLREKLLYILFPAVYESAILNSLLRPLILRVGRCKYRDHKLSSMLDSGIGNRPGGTTILLLRDEDRIGD